MDNVSNPIVIDQYHCESPETALNQVPLILTQLEVEIET